MAVVLVNWKAFEHIFAEMKKKKKEAIPVSAFVLNAFLPGYAKIHIIFTGLAGFARAQNQRCVRS